jgi:4-hydroxybenzoate polyprenyltransferase
MHRTGNRWIQLLRADRPAGIYLLLLPILWALYASPHPAPTPYLLLIFVMGAVVTRSGGCIVNDLLDRRFDRAVERTRHRPLADGRIRPRQALLLLAGLAGLGLILLLQLSPTSIMIGVLAVPLIGLYPLAKRWLPIPQSWLAIVFNLGALMAGVEMDGRITPLTWGLYTAAIFWTLAYDSIYACCDQADDQRLGLHSAPLLLGRHLKAFLYGCYGLMAAMWMLGWAARAGEASDWGVMVAGLLPIWWLGWMLRRLDLHNPAACLRHFSRQQPLAGGAMLLAILLENLIR